MAEAAASNLAHETLVVMAEEVEGTLTAALEMAAAEVTEDHPLLVVEGGPLSLHLITHTVEEEEMEVGADGSFGRGRC